MRAGSSLRDWLAGIYELGDTSKANRNLPMEGLRGLAVLLVFLVHYHALFNAWVSADSGTFAVSSFLWSIGHSGVDLFFVLSGYLIYGSVIRKHNAYTSFIKRRIERIYPTFLCVLAVYLLLSGVFPHESKIPSETIAAVPYILENILLLPGLFNIEPIITVAWSLSYEFFYYLFIPFLVALLAMRLWPKLSRVIFFFVLAGLLTGLSLSGYFHHLRLIMFIPGILLYEALHSYRLGERLKPGFDYQVLLLLLITFPLIYILSGQPGQVSLLLLPLSRLGDVCRVVVLFVSFFFLTLGCLSSQGLLKALFSCAPLRWYGNMSYSYYLIHGLTLKGVALGLALLISPGGNSPAIFWGILPIAFFLTLLSSTILFVFVEKRFSLLPGTSKATKSSVLQASAETVVTCQLADESQAT
jgi:peptidoglycan/LPS O-acetylase OafA/YrhL